MTPSPSPPQPDTVRAAAGMGAATAVSRLFGFVRVLVVAAVLGTTYLGNAFQAANSASNVLFELLAAGALSAVLVPAFVQLLDRGDRNGAEEVAGGVLGLALAVLGVVAVAGVVAAPLLAHLLTAGVPEQVASQQRELITFLLRFFVPQILLYAVGAVAIGALYAVRRFAVTAAAPIGNTIVMVAGLLAFRAMAGPDPGFALSGTERLLLAAAGTGGVIAFVAILVVACWRAGFRLRPRWLGRDPRVMQLARHSAWGVVLHSAAGLLLGAAIVTGAAVEGGVVAYQVAWVLFLAPYAVLAQPIHTALLPELVTEHRVHGPRAVATSLRWGLERMAVLVVPAAAGIAVLAAPAMRIVAFGQTSTEGAGLIAAALAGLAAGLLPYGAFLLLARGYYALGDSRTPGLVSLLVAGVGIALMVAAALVFDGTARIGALGVAHSAAYTLGAVTLAAGLRRRTAGAPLWGGVLLRIIAVAATAAVVGLVAVRLTAPHDRVEALVVCAAVGAVGAFLVLAGYRLLGVQNRLAARATT